jgi:hypothetical protein
MSFPGCRKPETQNQKGKEHNTRYDEAAFISEEKKACQ